MGTAEVAKNSRRKVPARGSKPGERRGGRQKGTPNKTTVAVKEALTTAFQGMGGVAKLQEWAEENPGEFYKLWGRMLPIEANVRHAAVTLEQLVAEAGKPQ